MADPARLPAEYASWTHEQLVRKIRDLEAQIPQTQSPAPVSGARASATATTTATSDADSRLHRIPYRKPPRQPPKPFDPSRYSTRLIALKFAYLGQKYNGFEHHVGNKTPLPTVEEEVWKALIKTRLISPTATSEGAGADAEVNWEGCEYSKCGRTDRGVSAFGQVIGVRVRSARPLPKARRKNSALSADGGKEGGEEPKVQPQKGVEDSRPGPEAEEEKPFDDTKELPYIQLLNRVLPPDIRFYAWCPNVPTDFSARFSCKERRYKYFFTNPCFAPVPGPSSLYTSSSGHQLREGHLDIAAMKEACGHLIGLHDFRNFCKIDASKQITNFKRRIFHADIEEISPLSLPSFLHHPALQVSGPDPTPRMYAFVLHGSAFLWHQVRSIIAILFLVGQGLEPASLVSSLLDMSTNPTRPRYEMASDAPLVLWDCIFPAAHEVQSSDQREHGYEDRLEWIYVGDPGAVELNSKAAGGAKNMGLGKWGRGGVVDDVWEVWRRNKMDETLSGLLLDRISGLGRSTLDGYLDMQLEEEGKGGGQMIRGARDGPRLFDGADVGKAKGMYVPVLQRERQESVEVINEKFVRRKGERDKGREADAGDE